MTLMVGQFPAADAFVSSLSLVFCLSDPDKENGPKTVKDVKLINAGRILENHRTVADCRSPLYDVPGGVTTMHVIVQPPPEKGTKILSAVLDLQC